MFRRPESEPTDLYPKWQLTPTQFEFFRQYPSKLKGEALLANLRRDQHPLGTDERSEEIRKSSELMNKAAMLEEIIEKFDAARPYYWLKGKLDTNHALEQVFVANPEDTLKVVLEVNEWGNLYAGILDSDPVVTLTKSQIERNFYFRIPVLLTHHI